MMTVLEYLKRYKILVSIFLFTVIGNVNSALEGRILGGSSAYYRNFPWMVGIHHYGELHCGGAIINENVILTAAHCVIHTRARFMKIHVGSKFLNSGGLLISVESIHRHPNFDLRTMDYDIALIKLKTELEFSDKVKPIDLPEAKESYPINVTATVTGWGFLKESGGFIPDILQYLDIAVFDQKLCNQLLGNNLTPRMLCAGNLRGGQDACQLDSGGPLVLGNKKIIGIVSWGVGCGRRNRPGVYTSVSELRSWIDQELLQM